MLVTSICVVYHYILHDTTTTHLLTNFVFTFIQTQLLKSYLDLIFVQISVLQTNPIEVYGSQTYNFFLSTT